MDPSLHKNYLVNFEEKQDYAAINVSFQHPYYVKTFKTVTFNCGKNGNIVNFVCLRKIQSAMNFDFFIRNIVWAPQL